MALGSPVARAAIESDRPVDGDAWGHTAAATGDLATAEGRARPLLTVLLMSGEVVLQLDAEDIDWPKEGEKRMLFVDNVLQFLRVNRRDICLYDIIGEGVIWDTAEPLRWGESYKLHKRCCARCSYCERTCTRSSFPHRVCSHGGLRHLWHRQVAGKSWFAVTGYVDLAGLDEEHTGLTSEELQEELDSIRREARAVEG